MNCVKPVSCQLEVQNSCLQTSLITLCALGAIAALSVGLAGHFSYLGLNAEVTIGCFALGGILGSSTILGLLCLICSRTKVVRDDDTSSSQRSSYAPSDSEGPSSDEETRALPDTEEASSASSAGEAATQESPGLVIFGADSPQDYDPDIEVRLRVGEAYYFRIPPGMQASGICNLTEANRYRLRIAANVAVYEKMVYITSVCAIDLSQLAEGELMIYADVLDGYKLKFAKREAGDVSDQDLAVMVKSKDGDMRKVFTPIITRAARDERIIRSLAPKQIYSFMEEGVCKLVVGGTTGELIVPVATQQVVENKLRANFSQMQYIVYLDLDGSLSFCYKGGASEGEFLGISKEIDPSVVLNPSYTQLTDMEQFYE